MTIENGIRILAGSMVLLSIVLSLLFSSWWLLLAGFVGVNLIQSAFTGFCPAERILKAIGAKASSTCSCTGENKQASSGCCKQ